MSGALAGLGPDPIAAFGRWFDEARARGVPLYEAMALATATPEGFPSARMVLLKQVDPAGFVFFTNYESRKAVELDANPRAALLFHWELAGRQVRVEGTVSRVTREESEQYVRSRLRGSQIASMVSPQSRPIPDRAFLEERYRAVDAQYPGDVLPVPEHWGGYRVAPARIEFWQSGEHRLHDRVLYERDGAGWKTTVLAP